MAAPNSIDLDGLDRDELIALQARIAERLKRIAQAERAKARRMIFELAGEHKIDLAELATQPQPPVYRDPQNEFNVWTGRGRQPAWVRARIAEGMTLEQLKAD